MFGVTRKPAAEPTTIQHEMTSDAPFQLQIAPGVLVVDAEITDRQSLDVLINAMKAFGAMLPEKPPEPPALPAPTPTNVTPQDAAIVQPDATGAIATNEPTPPPAAPPSTTTAGVG